MPETAPAPARVARIVHLVAWMSQRDSTGSVSYGVAARHLGVSERTLREDLDTLVRLTDDYKPWLASLSVVFTANGFVLSSRGHFRRPFRLTADETLALVLGLAEARRGHALATKLGAALARTPLRDRAAVAIALGPTPSEHVADVLGLAREALAAHQKLAIHYCGSSTRPGRRVIDLHQIAQREAWWYLIAWCETAGGLRHFRADRVLDAQLLDERFTPRADFKPLTRAEEVFRGEETIAARVAFGVAISRWMKEKYPGGREERDGRYVVTFAVADPAWLVREVLQYGAEAEVLEPESLRDAVRRAIGSS